jgi:hypothetical protein
MYAFRVKIYISFPAVHTPKIMQQKEVMRVEEHPMIENFFAQKSLRHFVTLVKHVEEHQEMCLHIEL